MNNSKSIEIVAVIDRSGSMIGMHEESISQINKFVRDKLEAGVKAKVTVAFFDNDYIVPRSRVKLEDFEPLSVDEVPLGGSTALNDAICKAINDSKKDKPTIFLIMTDGMENSSKEFTNKNARDMIAEREEAGCEFEYYGAGIDATSENSVYAGYGVKRGKGVSGPQGPAGVRGLYGDMGMKSTSFYAKVNSEVQGQVGTGVEDK